MKLYNLHRTCASGRSYGSRTNPCLVDDSKDSTVVVAAVTDPENKSLLLDMSTS